LWGTDNVTKREEGEKSIRYAARGRGISGGGPSERGGRGGNRRGGKKKKPTRPKSSKPDPTEKGKEGKVASLSTKRGQK